MKNHSQSDLHAARVASHLQMHLTLDQVAVMLSVSKRTVQRWVERREFREVVYPTTTDVRIPASAFAEFVEQRTVKQPRVS